MVSELADQLMTYFEDHRDLQDVPAIKDLAKEVRDKDKTKRPKSDFIVEEDILAIGAIAYMASKYKRYQYIIDEGFDKAIIDLEAGVIDQVVLNRALNEFDSIFKVTTFTQKQEQMIYEGIRASIGRGINFVTRSTELVPPVDIDGVIKRSAENLQYYSRESFGKIIVPKIQKVVHEVIADPSKAPAYSQLRETVNDFYKTEPYGKVVANSYSSRAYNWGSMKAAQARQYTFYKYRAIVDNRTSDICLALNGKVFDVNKGLARLEASMAARENQIEYVNPWVKVEDILGKSISEIEDIGANTPPNHAHCRSWIEPVRVSV